uniref:Uncharacterized protein n=1 Tax=Anguilla anguilla TaxID=7936 RepID=A0A0E9QJQ0_ANGAN
MCCSSRSPHWVPILSAKNRTMRLQWVYDHQNWMIESSVFLYFIFKTEQKKSRQKQCWLYFFP